MTSDYLSQFEQEDRIPGDSLFSLHEVIERRVPVHWDEAVAIVEEFCDVAIAASGETAQVPEVESVLIGSDGHVTLRRTRGDKSPTAAGRMLHALLSNGDVPTTLRLFVTQSTARDTHGSLREFARGLAYFGKPGREQLIRDVHARCARAGQRAADAPVEPPPLPKQESEPAKESDRQPKSKRNPLKKWVFAAAALTLAGAAAWLWKGGPAAHDVQGNAARMFSEAAHVLADLGQQVRDTLSPSTTAPTTTAVTSDDNVRPARSKRRASASPADTSGVEPAPLVGRQVSLPKSAGGLQLSAAVPNSVGFQPAAVYEQETEPEPEQAALYSSADHDVEPPVLTLPQLTPPLVGQGSSGGAMNRMVVIVSPEGTVERVQLVEGPARMVDMMLLSGAKTWKFTPALKDGEPVRYRTVISWAALP